MISELLGIDSDYVIIGLAVTVGILFIMLIVNIVQMNQLKKKYNIFMGGQDAKSLEQLLLQRLEQIDGLVESNMANASNIQMLFEKMTFTFQKIGLIKYNAFHEMGGKLSFSLALLNEKEDGFVLNAVHSREGCYTYIKEIIGGNAVTVLSEEEKEALQMAKDYK
ncbi:MAG: DUF4446 family protein [Lachnospiraceae bacterium]|nr:DUF4446 family protein [Lachnospiraceae bacterium]